MSQVDEKTGELEDMDNIPWTAPQVVYPQLIYQPGTEEEESVYIGPENYIG